MSSESKKRRRLGQIVCGPPGAGKSTYCNGMIQFFNAIGRKAVLINLDPACPSNASAERTSSLVRDFTLSFSTIVMCIFLRNALEH